MYEMYGALKSNLPKNRKAFVDLVAAQTATLDGSGMPQANVQKMIHTQIAVGNLTSSSAPSYTQIVDPSVYSDAAKLVPAG